MARHRRLKSGNDGRRRRSLVLLGIGVAATGLIAGNAIGAPTTSTTNVTFVAVSPAFKVVTGGAIAAHKTASYVVIGAATTVPTNATTVRLNVTVKGAAAGVLNFYPAGNVGGGSGQFLSWPAGGTSTGTIMENVGASNKVTFANSSSAAATVTATITGYSTQVTAGDINGTGGNVGQVLTDTGTGAQWADAGGTAYSDNPRAGDVFFNASGETTVASVLVPAGTYAVTGSGLVFADAGVNAVINCSLFAPDGNLVSETETTLSGSGSSIEASESTQGVMSTSGGTVTMQCQDFSGVSHLPEGVFDPSLTVIQVSNGVGSVVPGIKVRTTPHLTPGQAGMR